MLEKIIAYKKDEVLLRKKKIPLFDLSDLPPTRLFYQALKDRRPAVIAEVKKASPSKGLIAKDFDPVKTAMAYENAGAACLSVLTDEHFFKGHDDYLVEVRKSVSLPVLRKDFIIDPYQVYESRALGADAILLIVAALTPTQLRDYYQLAKGLDLHVLIECHNKSELEQALPLQPNLIGVNNRDLKTFKTNLNTTISLLPYIPNETQVVAESGIHTVSDIKFYLNHGVSTFLIGESLMKTPNPGKALEDLLNFTV